jgi:hypothetical protein
MNPAYTPIESTTNSPIIYTPPPIEYTPNVSQPQTQSYQPQSQTQSYQPQPQTQSYQEYETPSQVYQENTGDINTLYIDIQDYLDVLNSLYDKTKDTFISVNTVLENMKPFIYKKVNKNI